MPRPGCTDQDRLPNRLATLAGRGGLADAAATSQQRRGALAAGRPRAGLPLAAAWVLPALVVWALPTSRARASSPEIELAEESGAARAVEAGQRRQFGMRWRRASVAMGFDRTVLESLGRPAISRQHVIVGTGEGFVRAYSRTDGKLVWEYDYGEPFQTTAHVARDSEGRELVILGALDQHLLALHAADGSRAWRADVGGAVRAAPRKAMGALFVATANDRVHRVDINSGTVVWSRSRPGASGLRVDGHARPWVADGSVYAGFSDGYLEAYDAATGERQWSRPLSIDGGEFEDADADPLLWNGILYAASYSDGIYALSPDGGEVLWQRQAPSVVSLAHTGEALVAGSADGWVWGLEPNEGQARFRTRLPSGPVSQILCKRGMLLFTNGSRGLVALDAANGKPLQASAIPGRASGPAVWFEDDVAFLSRAGYVYLYGYQAPGLFQ